MTRHAFLVTLTADGKHRVTCRCGQLDATVLPPDVAHVKQRHLRGVVEQ